MSPNRRARADCSACHDSAARASAFALPVHGGVPGAAVPHRAHSSWSSRSLAHAPSVTSPCQRTGPLAPALFRHPPQRSLGCRASAGASLVAARLHRPSRSPRRRRLQHRILAIGPAPGSGPCLTGLALLGRLIVPAIVNRGSAFLSGMDRAFDLNRTPNPGGDPRAMPITSLPLRW